MKLWERYKELAVIVLNILIVLFIFNLIIGSVYLFKDSKKVIQKNPNVDVFFKNIVNIPLKYIFPGMSDAQIDRLLAETWNRTLIYTPYLQFTEEKRRGEFVNVSEHGYRISTDQGEWPPSPRNLNIFFFGGSTAFGYGVTDQQTIASYLQAALRKKMSASNIYVYNFGQAYFYSTQERILFEQLITHEHIPHIAIFFDGLNEINAINDVPFLNKEVEKRLAEDGEKRLCIDYLAGKIPMLRLAGEIHHALSGGENDQNFRIIDPSILKGNTVDEEETRSVISKVRTIIIHYRDNRRLIEAAGDEYGVETIFVWQPVPTYKYDLNYYAFKNNSFGASILTKLTYPAMEQYLAERGDDPNFVWAADLQEGIKDNLYVDMTHYSAAFSRLIGEFLAERLLESRTVKRLGF